MDLALMIIWFVFLVAWAVMYKSENKKYQKYRQMAIIGMWVSVAGMCGLRILQFLV